MKVSFDLDSTLIPHGGEFEAEEIGWLGQLFGLEPLRKGAKNLLDELKAKGCSLHVYTTSHRSIWKIRWMLLWYGIKVGRIVNEYENRRVLAKLNIHASKYPPAFGFDLHVDDAMGVAKEGERFGFEVILLRPNDETWADQILEHLTDMLND